MSAATETLDRPAAVRNERNGDAALTAWQVAYEQRAFWRNRTRAFFSFGMPVMLLVIFGSLNSGGRIEELGNIPYVTFFLPGILAYGIVITQFMNMAGGLAIQRDNGLLKRMRGTPLPGWAYVAGRVGSTVAVSLVMTVVMLVLGSVLYGVHVRAEALPGGRGGGVARSRDVRRAGHRGGRDHPERRGGARGGQRADPAALVHLRDLVPADRRPAMGHRRGEAVPGRAPGQCAAGRLRPGQPRIAFSGSDFLALGIWLLIGVRLAMRFWRKEMAR